MSEDETDHSREVFREEFRRNFIDFLDLAKIVGEPMSPDHLTMDLFERGWDDLTEDEKLEVREVIYGELGLLADRLDQYRVRDYVTHTGPDADVQGKIKVSVYKTNKEGIFLQELTYEDGKKSWLVGPNKNA